MVQSASKRSLTLFVPPETPYGQAPMAPARPGGYIAGTQARRPSAGAPKGRGDKPKHNDNATISVNTDLQGAHVAPFFLPVCMADNVGNFGPWRLPGERQQL